MRRLLPVLALALGAGLWPMAAEAGEPSGSEDWVRLALAARDRGEPEEALSFWTKAAELSPTDGFLLNQRGWASLALGRSREAKKSFAKAMELSPDAAGIVEAHLGAGLAQSFDGELKPAAQSFQKACKSPYLYPAAALLVARLALRSGRPDVALSYLKRSLEQDPFHPGAVVALARAFERNGSPRDAWRTYRMALGLDPLNSEAQRGMKKIEASLGEPAARLSAARRFSAPLLRSPAAPPPSPALRVGIFADDRGDLAEVRRIRFASGAGFKLVQGGKEKESGAADSVWEASWDSDGRVLEVRDSGRKLRYAGRETARIEPLEPGAGVLLRDAEIEDPRGRDLSDRELRGAVELRPAASGFFLINELKAEEYLYGRTASLSPAGAPPEELKAQAVLSRTALQGLRREFARPDLGTDLCDSSHCQLYLGLSQERGEATQAVQATAGLMLYRDSATIAVSEHAHCGGLTEDGIADAPAAPAPSRPPEALERFLHGDPAKEDLCNASPLAPPVWARWARILQASELEEAVPDRGRLGRIRSVRVLSRSAGGRVTGLEIAGSEGRAELKGEEALAGLLPRLGLRSSLFSFQPLYRGKDLEQLVVWGAGTGGGRGMCIAGALGQAAEGRGYKEILLHYFPGAEIR